MSELETTKQQVYHRAKTEILMGRWVPGQSLKENWVARQFEMIDKRTPVRQALPMLLADGFAEDVEGIGLRVPLIRGREVVSLVARRLALEALIGYELAQVEPSAKRLKLLQPAEIHLTELHDLVADKKELTEKELVRLVELDLAFHQSLGAASGFPFLDFLTKALHGLILTIPSFRVPGRQQEIYVEHLRIWTQLKDGNKDGVVSEYHKHLIGSVERWIGPDREFLVKNISEYYAELGRVCAKAGEVDEGNESAAKKKQRPTTRP